MSIGDEGNLASEGPAKSIWVDERIGVTAFGKGRTMKKGLLRNR